MSVIKKAFKSLPLVKQFLSIYCDIAEVKKRLANIERNFTALNCEDYIKRLKEDPKYRNSKRLNEFEFQVFSQSGEDGIIDEIFKRIGTTNRFFVEFGVTDGPANNTVYLLLNGWKGLWIENNAEYVKQIQKKYRSLIDKKILLIKNAFITAENIETLFNESGMPKEIDLMSIDVDMNDYWIWKAIKNYYPRVVVIEYNAIVRHIKWVVKHNPENECRYSSHFGASLKSLEILGLEKRYRLVGCNLAGTNAFFVREDLVGDKFLEPFTSENHYEPPRYYLARIEAAHPMEFGDFENI